MIFLTVGCGIIFCILLLLLSARFTGFSSFLERPLGIIAVGLDAVARPLKKTSISLLEHSSHKEGERSLVVIFIARIIYLLIAGVLILVEFPRFTQLSNAVMHTNSKTLGSLFDLSFLNALLMVIVLMSLVLMLAECTEKIPLEWRILPQLSKWERIIGSFLCTISIAGYIATIAIQYGYGQCVIDDLACKDQTGLVVYTVVAQIALLLIASIPGVIAILLGAMALTALGAGLLYCVVKVLQFFFALFSDTVHGARSPYRQSLSPVALSLGYQQPVIDASQPLQLTSGQQLAPLEVLTEMKHAINFIGGIGSYGFHGVPMLLETAKQTGMNNTFVAAGVIDLDRIDPQDRPLVLIEGHDISPKNASINAALAGVSVLPPYTKLTEELTEDIVKVYENKHGGNITFMVDINKLPFVYTTIRKLKQRLPNQQVMLFLVLPSIDQRAQMLTSLESFTRTATATEDGTHDKILALVIDPYAGSAISIGEETEEKVAASTLLSLCNAVLHDDRNPTLASVIDRMSMQSPYISVSSSILSVSPGKISGWSGLAKLFNKNAPEIGSGDLNDLIHQSIIATTNAIEDPLCRSTQQAIDTDKPFYVLYTVPLMPADKKRWNEYTTAMQRYVKRTYNGVGTPIIVHANPPQPPDMKEKYRISATVIYPLLIQSLRPHKIIETTVQSVVESNNEDTDEELRPLPLASEEESEDEQKVKQNGRRKRVTQVSE